MSDESLIEKVAERSVKQTTDHSEEVAEEVGNCLHRMAAFGCYTLAVASSLFAMGSLWTWFYNPTDFVTRLVCGSVTLVAIVVFFWGLFIKKWWFLR